MADRDEREIFPRDDLPQRVEEEAWRLAQLAAVLAAGDAKGSEGMTPGRSVELARRILAAARDRAKADNI